MTVLAKNLKRLRCAKGLTQEQAAEVLGVTGQTVSRWECDTTLPDVMQLPALARLYCVSIDDLYRENSVAYDNYAQRLGAVYETTGQLEDFLRADQEYRQLLRSGNYRGEDLRLYGVLYQLLMEEAGEKAMELFDRVLSQGPEGDPETYWRTQRQRIWLCSRRGMGEKTLAEQREALEMEPGEVNRWICLIQALQLCGRTEEARERMERALNRFPPNPCLYVFCGDVWEELGNYDRAFRCWEKALELDESYVDARYSMGFCCQRRGEYARAAEIWEDLARYLEEKGFDLECNYPKKLARECREKAE